MFEGVVGFDFIFVDIDYLMFCFGEVYLIYVEVVFCGVFNGDLGIVVVYINVLCQWVYNNDVGNILEVDFNLDFIFDECSCELYWEGVCCIDFICFG